jgi:hypothetical protein
LNIWRLHRETTPYDSEENKLVNELEGYNAETVADTPSRACRSARAVIGYNWIVMIAVTDPIPLDWPMTSAWLSRMKRGHVRGPV